MIFLLIVTFGDVLYILNVCGGVFFRMQRGKGIRCHFTFILTAKCRESLAQACRVTGLNAFTKHAKNWNKNLEHGQAIIPESWQHVSLLDIAVMRSNLTSLSLSHR